MFSEHDKCGHLLSQVSGDPVPSSIGLNHTSSSSNIQEHRVSGTSSEIIVFDQVAKLEGSRWIPEVVNRHSYVVLSRVGE